MSSQLKQTVKHSLTGEQAFWSGKGEKKLIASERREGEGKVCRQAMPSRNQFTNLSCLKQKLRKNGNRLLLFSFLKRSVFRLIKIKVNQVQLSYAYTYAVLLVVIIGLSGGQFWE